MSYNVVADGAAWAIEDNNTPDAYIQSLGAGRFVLDPEIVGGCWIFRNGPRYTIEPAGQPTMAVSHAIVTASTSAVALNTASSGGVTLTLKNTSGNAADLGASTVTAGTGFALAASAVVTITLKPGDVLYAIRSGGSDATIAVLRT